MKKYYWLTLIVLASCVSQKKYDSLNGRTSSLIVENQDLKDSLSLSEAENEDFLKRLNEAGIRIEDLVEIQLN